MGVGQGAWSDAEVLAEVRKMVLPRIARYGPIEARARNHFACFSNRDTLPPLGFAAALPVSRQRRIQLMTELGLTLKCSATSRREAPDLISSIARSRKSSEYGLGIEFPPAKSKPPPEESFIAQSL